MKSEDGLLQVVLYRETDGSVPVLDWLAEVGRRDRRVPAKCWARLDMLAEFGNRLRRPFADYLRDGIYELRLEYGGVNYRMLYFFSRGAVVVVSHGLTKEAKVPDREIELAVARKRSFETDPARFTYEQKNN
jgi:phage-related protein